MTIAFNDIPANLRAPGFFIEFDASRAVAGSPAQPHITILIGHSTTATDVLAFDTPTRIFSTDDANARAGRGSALALMVERYRKVDPLTELWVLPITDVGGGAKAEGTFTFNIPSAITENGTAVVYIGDHRIPVPVSTTDTGTDVASAVVAEIDKDPTRYPVTAVSALGVVTLTSRNDTAADNGIRLGQSLKDGERLPTGLALVTVDLTAGTGDPDVTTGIANIGDQQFHTIVTQFSDDTNMDLLEAMLLTRWGPLVSIEGHLFAAIADTVGNSTTAGNARNSFNTSLIALQETPTPHWAGAAQVAARDALQVQTDPARPRQTLTLPDVFPPPKVDQWTYAERNIALGDGLATVKYDAGTGTARIDFLTTTFQTNASGAPDPSFLSIITPRLIARLRFDVRTRFATKFPRHKLAADGTFFEPSAAVMQPRRARAEFIALFREWQAKAWVEDIEQFKDELIVEINADNPDRLDVLLSPNLINAFRILAGQMQFLL